MASSTLLAIATLVATASAEAGSEEEIVLLSERLGNGLLVTICQDPALQLVATQHWIHAGGKQSPEGQEESAHIVEHLLFAGTERTPAGRYERFHQAHGGRYSGATAYEYTVYGSLVPPEAHEELLLLEADRFQHHALRPSDFERERRIVAEELRGRYENDPFGKLAEQLGQASQQVDAQDEAPLLPHEEALRTELETVQAYYDRWYRPEHMHLVIVGPLDAGEIFAQVEAQYGSLRPGPPPPVRPEKETEAPAEQRGPVSTKLQTDSLPASKALVLSYTLPGYASELGLATQVLLALLANEGQDLYFDAHRSVDREVLAARTTSWQGRTGSMLRFQSAHARNRLDDTVRSYGSKALIQLRRARWLTEADVETAKLRLWKENLRDYYYADTRARALGLSQLRHGSVMSAFQLAGRLKAISLQEVKVVWVNYVAEVQPSVILLVGRD